MKNIKTLNIKYWDIQIKQHSKDAYQDKTMSGLLRKLWLLTLQIKLATSLKFFIVKSFLTPALRRVLWNASIQPLFDYAF